MKKAQATGTRYGGMLLTLIMGCAWTSLADSLPTRLDKGEERRFRNEVEPLLEQHCYECHSHAAKKAKGGLVLDSRSGWSMGGDSGPAVIPGRPEQSLLISAVRREDLEMPPDGRLADDLIQTLVQWVSEGAFDPRQGLETVVSEGIDLDAGRRHWAFQDLAETTIPTPLDRSWPRRDLDSFILQRLEGAGLSPGADADPYTWLRRVTFDLTGLPPEREDVIAFGKDPSLQARERIVDRLLASRAFGERWARHWLDLVGYADQVGTSNNVFAEHAWRFRDYVIDAYNRDMPFDRFIREQVAGDLLAHDSVAERAQQLTATGFLVLGDIEIVESDKAKLLVDIVDQQISKVGKAFLGLTLECARCHDHKFDPIRQQDYYAMGGFFQSTSSIYKTDRGVWSDVHVVELPESEQHEASRLLARERHFKQLENWKKERSAAQSRRKVLEGLLSEDELVSAEEEGLRAERERLSQDLKRLNQVIPHAEYFYPKSPAAHGVKDVAKPTDMRITIRGNPRALGDSVPRGFLSVTDSEPVAIAAGQSGRLELAEWITRQPLTARVAVNRVWQKLFGEGLVRTVDYFGVPGDRPSHPKLLDYLAREFVAQRWSMKRLIRNLVLSRAYGLASTHDAQAAVADPENRLLWKMNAFRLDAEALRDGMLLVSGSLVASGGGPSLPLEYPENVGGLDPKDVNPRSFRFSKWRPWQSYERTVYLPVIRHAAQPGPANLRNVFDFAQPSEFAGKRSVTAVPTQALYLMNDADVRRHAEALWRSIEPLASESERFRELWLRVFNRPVVLSEQNAASSFVASMGERGWLDLCHALLINNEFLMRL